MKINEIEEQRKINFQNDVKEHQRREEEYQCYIGAFKTLSEEELRDYGHTWGNGCEKPLSEIVYPDSVKMSEKEKEIFKNMEDLGLSEEDFQYIFLYRFDCDDDYTIQKLRDGYNIQDVLATLIEQYREEKDFYVDKICNPKKSMIYLDMDGFVAEFNTNASIEDTFKEGYFANCKPDNKAIRIAKTLMEEHEDKVKFLIHVYDLPWCKKEKEEFLKKYDISAECIFVPYGKEKYDYVDMSSHPILIDDFTKNLKAWEEHGGIGVKYLNGINGTKGTWDGLTISHKMKLETVQKLLNALIIRS